jgi:transcriptional regulator with XRE-family HTH domain
MTLLTTSTAGTFVSDADDAKAANTTRNSIDKFVGSRLRARRNSCGISEKELSEKLQTDPNDVRAYEEGAKRIGTKLLLRIAQLLDVRPDYFFQGCTAGELSNLKFEQINANPTTRVDESFILRQAFDSIANDSLRQATATIVIEVAKVSSADLNTISNR